MHIKIEILCKGQSIQCNELNIEFIKRDIGTGYHCKEGIYIGYGKIMIYYLNHMVLGKLILEIFLLKLKNFLMFKILLIIKVNNYIKY